MPNIHSPILRHGIPPHISFIIDLDLFRSSRLPLEEIEARIQAIVLKIMIFFYTCVNSQFLWSYQLLEIHSASALGMDESFTQHGDCFCPEALHKFQTKLKQALISSRRKTEASIFPSSNKELKIYKIDIVMRNCLSQFRWSWSRNPGLNSPPGKASGVFSRVENYLFIICDLPKTSQEVLDFFGLDTNIKKYEAKAVEIFHKRLVHKDLWESFKSQRISVTWIDDIQDISSFEPPISHSLIPSLSLMFRLYSSQIIPAKIIIDRCIPLPFSKLFEYAVERYTNYTSTSDKFFGKTPIKTYKQCLSSMFDENKIYSPYIIERIRHPDRNKLPLKDSVDFMPPEMSNITYLLFNIDYKDFEHCFYVSKRKRNLLPNNRTKRKIEAIGLIHLEEVIRKKALKDGILFLTPNVRDNVSVYKGFAALDSLKIFLESERKSLVVWIEVYKDLTGMNECKKSLKVCTRIAVITSFIQGAAILQFVDDACIGDLLDAIQVENPNNKENHSLWLSSNKHLEKWYSGNPPKNVSGILFSDWQECNTDALLHESIYALGPEYIERKRVKKPTKPSPRVLQTKERTVQKEQISNEPEEPINSYEDFCRSLHLSYIKTLYDLDGSIIVFLDRVLPSLYLNLNRLANVHIQTDIEVQPEVGKGSEDVDKKVNSTTLVGFFLEYLAKNIIMSVSQLEHKYRQLPKIIEQIDSISHDEDFEGYELTINKIEIPSLAAWVRKYIDIGDSSKPSTDVCKHSKASNLRKRILELKIQEAKLQILILLECLRLHIETSTPLLALQHKHSRFSELMRPKQTSSTISDSDTQSKEDKEELYAKRSYLRSIEELTDRLCIWNSVMGMELDSGGNKLLKQFIEPMVAEFYQFSLPEIVKLLHLKVGGDLFDAENSIASPSSKFIIDRGVNSFKLRQEKTIITKKSKTKKSPILESLKSEKDNQLPKELKIMGRRQVIVRKKVTGRTNRTSSARRQLKSHTSSSASKSTLDCGLEKGTSKKYTENAWERVHSIRIPRDTKSPKKKLKMDLLDSHFESSPQRSDIPEIPGDLHVNTSNNQLNTNTDVWTTPLKNTPGLSTQTPQGTTPCATPGSLKRLQGLLQTFADLDYWEELTSN